MQCISFVLAHWGELEKTDEFRDLMLYYPEKYNAFSAFLLSLGLTALSIYASSHSSQALAERTANRRWLPQAEGACDRLLTLQHAVKCFRLQTKNACVDIGSHLPELNDKKNASVRALLHRQCDDSAQRLQDFVNQLTSFVQDWRRFIRETCQDGECETIFTNLDDVSERLCFEYESTEKALAPGCSNEVEPVAHSEKSN